MMQVGFDDAASRYIDAVLDVPELEVLMLCSALTIRARCPMFYRAH